MKKNLFIILLMLAMISIQNLHAQKKHTLSAGTKKMEIVGELHYEDDIFGNSYVNIEKDKIVLWQNIQSTLRKESINFADIDTGSDGMFVEEESSYSAAYFSCKDGKFCEQILYSGDEKRVIPKKDAGIILTVKFKTKAEAEAFMAKAKKAMKK